MENDSYLYERVYKKEIINLVLPEQWKKIMGEESLQLLCKEYTEISLFLNGTKKYSLKREFMGNEYNELLNIYRNDMYINEVVNIDRYQNKLFGSFYIPFMQLAQYYGRKKFEFNIEKYSSIGILDDLFDSLSIVCTRILISEIQLHKDQLIGEKEDEKYKYYISHYLNDKDYIDEIFKEYPVMLRCILDKICSVLSFYSDFFKKWKEDIEKIRSYMRLSSIEIIGLKRVGDTHRNGQSVIKIFLKDGHNIFYKPHSLKVTKIYYKIFSQICENCGLREYDYQIMDRGEYGWEKEIDVRPCNKKEEIQRYYTRIGIHIMISYILDVQDLHYENLIAHGEYPIFIDIEIVCGNIIKYKKELSADEKAHWLLSSSILGNGILPCNSKVKDLFCALNGKGGVKTDWKTWKIVNAMTSEIKLEYVETKTPNGKNIPFLRRKKCDYNEYIENIYLGFTESYRYICQNKEIFMNQSQNFISRLIINNTQYYSKLIHLSYHPMFMNDGGARQLILSQRFLVHMNDNEKIGKEVFESEVYALINGDIPYFSFKSGDKRLILEKNRTLPYYLDTMPEEYIKIRLRSLSPKDLRFQQKLFSYVTGYRNINSIKEMEVLPENKCDVINICNEIGKYIEKYEISDNSNDASWIIYSKSTLHVADMHLYEGISGLAVFFAALNKLNTSDQFAQIEWKIINKMVNYTISEDIHNCYSGAYCGEASIIYAYILLYKIKDDKNFIKYAEIHEEKLYRQIKKDKAYDLLYGNAGAVIVYLHLYKITVNEKYLNRAKIAADYLVEKGIKTSEGIYWISETHENHEGLAHGGSGFSLCFAKLYKVTHEIKYLNVAIKAIYYENKLYDESINNWVDQKHKSVGETRVYWCHGAGGIALAREEMINLFVDYNCEYILKDFQRAIKKLEDFTNDNMRSLCLCHGMIGNLMILKDCREVKGYKKYWNEIYSTICKNFKSNSIDYCENGNPGLMTGLSGVGYGLLYIFCNKQKKLPNILKLEI